MKTSSPIIVAVDAPTLDAALHLADRLDPADCRLKVGKELFTATGPAVVEALQKKGFEIFLDLKFHDIPNTVAGACRVAADLGVWMVDIHVSGSVAMMEAAKRAVDSVSQPPILVGITVLTSLNSDDLQRIGLQGPVDVAVSRLAHLARDSGLDGVVCSAAEAPLLRRSLPKPFVLVTPGIRPSGGQTHDQVRVVTPREALESGSTYLVIGRPITESVDPAETLKDILKTVLE
jgi:orotidine-5'-phosphate decarboxylase